MTDTALSPEERKHLLDIHLREYDKIKTEQTRRIGFRDNLLYVTLSLYGGIFSYAITDQSHYYAFLTLPWVCFVLGWTYLVNDEKISAIGRYIRETLKAEIYAQKLVPKENLFGWEVAHRNDKLRKSRKYFQLLVDEVTFCVSGLLALWVFWFTLPDKPDIWIGSFMTLDAILLVILGVWIWVYADLKKGDEAE